MALQGEAEMRAIAVPVRVPCELDKSRVIGKEATPLRVVLQGLSQDGERKEMEAKDTVMRDEQMSKFIQFPVEGYTTDRLGLCQAQAEISFKAGVREVVEWARLYSDITCNPGWQDKLKEWGIV